MPFTLVYKGYCTSTARHAASATAVHSIKKKNMHGKNFDLDKY